jgi:hypothetical protein
MRKSRSLLLRLYEPDDQDIIDWLARLEKERKTLARELKAALRHYIAWEKSPPASVDECQLRDMVLRIVQEMLPNGVPAPGGTAVETDADSQLIDNALDDINPIVISSDIK